MLTWVNSIHSAAQSGTSSALTGTISDPSGAMLPSARVKAAEVNTGAIRITQSNSEGRYLFAQVNPGNYRITVEATGFAKAESQPANVAVGQTIAVDFTLSPSKSLRRPAF